MTFPNIYSYVLRYIHTVVWHISRVKVMLCCTIKYVLILVAFNYISLIIFNFLVVFLFLFANCHIIAGIITDSCGAHFTFCFVAFVFIIMFIVVIILGLLFLFDGKITASFKVQFNLSSFCVHCYYYYYLYTSCLYYPCLT